MKGGRRLAAASPVKPAIACIRRAFAAKALLFRCLSNALMRDVDSGIVNGIICMPTATHPSVDTNAPPPLLDFTRLQAMAGSSRQSC